MSRSWVRRLEPVPEGEVVSFEVDGRTVRGRVGESLLAALLANGLLALRLTERLQRPRGAYCGMGVCMDCLVMVEGVGLVRACAEPVREGMVCRTGLEEDAP